MKMFATFFLYNIHFDKRISFTNFFFEWSINLIIFSIHKAQLTVKALL